MSLIQPPEIVTVDLGALHTVIRTIRTAAESGEEFRAEITAATRALARAVAPALHADAPLSGDVAAEPLWWLVQGADEIGHEYDLPPCGLLFEAVDRLATALAEQAPRTDYGMCAVLEAEVTCAIYDHVITEEKKNRG